MSWTEEKIFFKTQDIFDSFIIDCDHAKKTIWIEIFSFEDGKLLQSIMPSLNRASKRGVDVRIIIDAMGSLGTSKNFMSKYPLINVKQFNPLSNLFLINRRDHRKLFLFDQTIAYVGSSNIDDKSLHWRESAVRLKGSSVSFLVESFYRSWLRVDTKGKTLLELITNKTKRFLQSFHFRKLVSKRIILTDSAFDRMKVKQFWANKINKAKGLIWISTPYFIPTSLIYISLLKAVQRGVDVRILIPAKNNSDFPFTKNIERYYVESLLKNGVKVYEYLPKMIHAKVCMFDRQVIIGSSNWNHRSRYLDLELDVILSKSESHDQVQNQFLIDFSNSHEVSIDNFPKVNIFQKIVYRILMLIRYWC